MKRIKNLLKLLVVVMLLITILFGVKKKFFSTSAPVQEQLSEVRGSDALQPKPTAPLTQQEETDLKTYQKKANEASATEDMTGRIAVPLLLQKNPEWSNLAYGTGDGSGTLGENGCALVALTMLTAYYENRTVTPEEILQWSGETYYVSGAGTSWDIFPAYSQAKNWEYQNFGSDLEAAKKALADGKPVIASVKAGTFTDNGHILLLTGYEGGNFWVNDSNDSAEKKHFYETFPEELIANEGRNFWCISP